MHILGTEEGKRNRHIDVRYHVCQEAVGNGEVKLQYYPSVEMMASTLTKPLRPQKFNTVKDFIPMTVSFNEKCDNK